MVVLRKDEENHMTTLLQAALPTRKRVDRPMIIDLQDVTIRFGKFTAVDSVNLQVKPGEVFGLLGPNGSGKTTLIRAMCGLLPFASGSVHVLGKDVTRYAEEVRMKIGY